MASPISFVGKIEQSKRCNVTNVKNNTNNCETSSTPDYFNWKNDSTSEILNECDVGKSLLQCRYLVTLLGFFVCCQTNIYRLATSISLVAMVNNSAISYEKNSSKHIDICTFNSSSEEEFAVSEMERDFNWSPDTQGYILSAGFISYVILLIPGGMLSETYGGKIIVVSGVFSSTMGHLLSPLAAQHSSSLMIVAQLIRGAGQGLLVSAISVVASNWFPGIERGLHNSIIMSGTSVGSIIIGFSAGAMCSSSFLGGWPSVYYIYGGIGLLQCFCIQIFLYESPKDHPHITEIEKNYILYHQEADLNKKRPPTPWKDISESVPFYAMTYAIFGTFWAAGHLVSIHTIYLTTVLHFSLNENGFFIAIIFLIQSLFSFGTSFVSNWLFRRNVVGVDWLRKGINLIACIGYSLGLLGVYLAGCNRDMSNLLAIIGMSFSGLVYGGCLIAPIDMSPTFAGTLMGLSTTVGSSAAFIFPLIYGVMMEKEQSLEQWNNIYFISIAIIMSSGIIFCIFGSAEIQPWNYASDEQMRNNGKSRDNVTEETNSAFEAVAHI